MKHLNIEAGDGTSVEAALYGPGELGLGVVLGHGTNGDLNHPLLVHFAAACARAGVTALTFNFPYRQRGDERRDPEPVLEESVRRAAGWLMAELTIERLVLGGKSLGARMSSQVVAAGLPAAGLLLLGYPLHPPDRPAELRDAHLMQVSCPMRFLHGDTDRFAYPHVLDAAIARLRAAGKDVALDRIEGTHGLRDTASDGKTTNHWDRLADGTVSWLLQMVEDGPMPSS